MATLSSHVLDSVRGTHASHIRIQCFRRSEMGAAALVFETTANANGRINESFDTDPDAEYELVFQAREYFETVTLPDDGYQIMQVVVVRLSMPDPDATYHLPLVLAPHSYTLWWSGAAAPSK